MNIATQRQTDQEDKPLTRADVERLVQEAGSPDELDLSGKNLRGIDLTHINLAGANLKGAVLIGADLRNATLKDANLREALLRGANLTGADLSRADLSNADLHQANLRKLDLSRTNLRGADLVHVYLQEANLRRLDLSGVSMKESNFEKVDLSGANLSGAEALGSDFTRANMSGANLSGADLSHADLHEADLSRANLIGVKLFGADLTNATISSRHVEDILRGTGISIREEKIGIRDTTVLNGVLRIRITEDPLTAHNLTMIIASLTELNTKCWLIARRRFDDLTDYSQTHNIRYVEEANLVINKLSYNSPAEIELTQGKSSDTKSKSDLPINVDVKVEATPQAVMEALGKAIDGVVQSPLRFKEKQLEIQAKIQDLKQAEQKAAQDSQIALLQKEKQELEIERQRLELVEKRLEIQKKGIEYALEIASKTVDVLYPTANAETKAMLTRMLLPTILQLDNVKGVELVLPPPQSSEGETETK